MKGLLLFLFLIIGIKSFGQNSILFDKVIFTYFNGYNSFGSPGVYSKGEVFEFCLINSTAYRIKKYIKTMATAGKDGGTFSKDTIKTNTQGHVIPARSIDSLWLSLTNTKNNFTTAFIRRRLRSPSKEEILRIAKNDSLFYKFEDDDVTEINAKINKLKAFDQLNYFINSNRPNVDMVNSTVDAWDILKISFIKNGDTTVFNQDYLQLLGQPILKLKVNKQYVNQQFINLDVNILLREMLPSSSILEKRASINGLTEKYVLWYIKEKI
jgi:hypothetical protein